jgi:hypothetical protein
MSLTHAMMIDPATLAADPAWLPHRYDAQAQQVTFVNLDRETMRGLTFLADYQPVPGLSAAVPAAQVAAMHAGEGPLHFIFHTAFCRSTLLARSMGMPGLSLGLSEPGVLNDLTMAGKAAQPLIAPVAGLLARPQGEGEAVIVKPSNVANPLIPALMQARGEARAVLLGNSLEAFLRSVHKKGMMGRRWARRLYLHVQQYASLDLGMDGNALFEASDMQVAGLAWFLQQRWFAMLLDTPLGARMMTLDADELVADREAALGKVTRWFGIGASAQRLREVADGPLFTRHAKLGGDYAQAIAEQDAAARSEVVEEEIAMVATWVGQIVAQTGLSLPVRKG